MGYLPSFLRCTRVRRSSLRCFFFDMRLRRFLMTEPMNSATSVVNDDRPVTLPGRALHDEIHVPQWTCESLQNVDGSRARAKSSKPAMSARAKSSQPAMSARAKSSQPASK